MSRKHLQRLNALVLSLYLGKYNDPGNYFLWLQTLLTLSTIPQALTL